MQNFGVQFENEVLISPDTILKQTPYQTIKPYFQVNRTFSGVTCENLCFWLGKMKYYMKKIGSQKLESQYPTVADIKCAPISMQQLEENKPR